MSVVTLDIQNDIAVIRLDDGGHNVINHQVLDELEAAWEKAESDGKVVIFSGREGSFCAGYDINVMTGDDPNASTELGRRGGRLAYQLFKSSRPVIAVSPGHAFTIGAVWLACCDIRIGEIGQFKYGMSEIKLNVAFSAWPLEPMKERLVQSEFVQAMLHSKIYDPESAKAAGFLDEVVAAGEGMSIAMQRAEALIPMANKAYAQSKLQFRKDALATMAKDLGIEV